MTDASTIAPTGWRASLPQSIRPYTEAAPIAALFVGISSGFPYAMIGPTLTTRPAQDGIDQNTAIAAMTAGDVEDRLGMRTQCARTVAKLVLYALATAMH